MKSGLFRKYFQDKDVKDIAECVKQNNETNESRIVNYIFSTLESNISKENNENDPAFKVRAEDVFRENGFVFTQHLSSGGISTWTSIIAENFFYKIYTHGGWFAFYLYRWDRNLVASLRLPYRSEFFDLVKEIMDNEDLLLRAVKLVELELRMQQNNGAGESQ